MNASEVVVSLTLLGCSAMGSCENRNTTKVRELPRPNTSVMTAIEESPTSASSAPYPVQVERASEAIASPSSPRPLAPFPDDIPLHRPEDVVIPGDRPLRVAHAPGDQLAAVIYLPGMCGNPKGADPWVDLATAHATVITVRGNVKCPDRPGYKWPREPAEIQPRIDAALQHVADLRAGHLETASVTLIGYSQGAHRGEKLAAAYPERYRALVLGGPPTAPDPKLLARASSVAILGGELEDTNHMRKGFNELQLAGIPSRFFVLPGAHHGSYGPQGRRIMKNVLAFSFGVEPDPRHVRSETPASH